MWTIYYHLFLSFLLSMCKIRQQKGVFSLSKSKNFDFHKNNQRLIYRSIPLSMLLVLQKNCRILELCTNVDNKNFLSMCTLNKYDCKFTTLTQFGAAGVLLTIATVLTLGIIICTWASSIIFAELVFIRTCTFRCPVTILSSDVAS